jgi:acetate---CoA ligase (ADP-forming)
VTAPVRPRLRRMLQARSVAVVGASDRPDSFGWRMTTEVLRSPGLTEVHLVNPTRDTVLGHPCLPSLADVSDPVDLVLLGVPDKVLVDQVRLASDRGDAGAVVFGAAHGLREELTGAADGLEVCGAGCMGFVNVPAGVRALGYLEPDPLPVGPIALVTHSGSVFSAMLRSHRRLEYSLVVSSGQELVTTTADYLGYALSMPQTRVVGLVLETLRDVRGLRSALEDATERDVPVVALTVGTSTAGQPLVDAHSGALAGSDAAWEAMFGAHGVHRCDDLGELVDSLETFAIGRRVRRRSGGIATVHDSGAERVLVADIAERLAVPFAPLSASTTARLAGLLDPGLEVTNPLDVWGTGTGAEDLFAGCLEALADDDSVDVVALAVDLVPEYDGDDSFPRALDRLVVHTDKPVVVLTNLSSAVDQPVAARLRAEGIPVLEGTRSGLRALGHLLAQANVAGRRPTPGDPHPVDLARQSRWRERLASGDLDALALVADYGIAVPASMVVESAESALTAAVRFGFPVVLKTAQPQVHHKADAGGVLPGLVHAESVRAAYRDLADRLGPRVEVQRQVPAGIELALGIVADPHVGALVLVAAGGTLVELLADRAVALPPVAAATARDMLTRLNVSRLLEDRRGGARVDVDALVAAVRAVSQLAVELGDRIEGLDVNPVIVGPDGAIAVDALVIPSGPRRTP